MYLAFHLLKWTLYLIDEFQSLTIIWPYVNLMNHMSVHLPQVNQNQINTNNVTTFTFRNSKWNVLSYIRQMKFHYLIGIDKPICNFLNVATKDVSHHSCLVHYSVSGACLLKNVTLTLHENGFEKLVPLRKEKKREEWLSIDDLTLNVIWTMTSFFVSHYASNWHFTEGHSIIEPLACSSVGDGTIRVISLPPSSSLSIHCLECYSSLRERSQQ